MVMSVQLVPQLLSAVQTGLEAARSVQISISLTRIIYTQYTGYLVLLVCLYVLLINDFAQVYVHECKVSCLPIHVFLTFRESQFVYIRVCMCTVCKI